MRQIPAWTTADGQIFTSEREAARHALARYGAALTRLAHAVIAVDKYRDAHAFIESALPGFLELERLRADCTLEAPPEND